MEGHLLVPPDSRTIIGRPQWKPRYVTLGSTTPHHNGSIHHMHHTSALSRFGRKNSAQAVGRSFLNDAESTHSSQSASHSAWISIYKQKTDTEPVSQISVSAIRSCELKTTQYKKSGPTLPTLVISMHSEPPPDKLQKRRSSRAAGLSGTSGGSSAKTVYFRCDAKDSPSLYEWKLAIEQLVRPHNNLEVDAHEREPLGPLATATNVLSSFRNPFSNQAGRPPTAPGTSSADRRPELSIRAISNNYVDSQLSRDESLMSPVPSLKSRRSDLSSHASIIYPIMSPLAQNGVHPVDLPTPAPTLPGAYSPLDGFIEGSTSAQGRSSALSNHTRNSNSVSTCTSAAGTTSAIPTIPSIPRESILDRAFQMKYIPGSDRLPEDTLKQVDPNSPSGQLSSIVKFEALMRSNEQASKQAPSSSRKYSSSGRRRAQSNLSHKKPGKSWDLAEEDEEEHSGGASSSSSSVGVKKSPVSTFESSDDSSTDSGASSSKETSSPRRRPSNVSKATKHSSHPKSKHELGEDDTLTPSLKDIPPTAARALQYLASGRTSPPLLDVVPDAKKGKDSKGRPKSQKGRRPSVVSTKSAALTPTTSGPSSPTRGHSRKKSRPQSMIISSSRGHISRDSVRDSPTGTIHEEKEMGDNSSLRRGKTTRDKRLSFEEFTKRLSNSSSVLVVQTNTSNPSNGSNTSNGGRGGEVERSGRDRSKSEEKWRPRERKSNRDSFVMEGGGGWAAPTQEGRDSRRESLGTDASDELEADVTPDEMNGMSGRTRLRQSSGLRLGMGLRDGGLGGNPPPTPGSVGDEQERAAQAQVQMQMKRCGWRGSVGVFGGEGGFL